MGLGPCTIHGQSFPMCTVTGNVDRRRTLYLENPVAGQWLASSFDTLMSAPRTTAA